MEKHSVVYDWMGIEVTASMTQMDLVELLKREDIVLISVNDSGVNYGRSRRKFPVNRKAGK